jgi:hypothetical protein
MVETKLEIRFPRSDEARAVLNSTARGDAEKQAEIVLFCHYVARVVRKVGEHESTAPLIGWLTRLENAPTDYLLGLAEEDPPVETGGEAVVGIDASGDTAPADKRLLVRQRLFSARNSPRILLTVKARGFGLGRQGLDRALATSVSVLMRSMVERRADDTTYLHQVARAGAFIGRIARTDRALLVNEVGVVLAAADAGWQLPLETLGPGGARGEQTNGRRAERGEQGAEIQCPACGNTASNALGNPSFDYMVWPEPTARLGKCGHCGGGVWVRDGRARMIAADAWMAMDALRGWLERGDADAGELPAERDERSDVPIFDSLKAAFGREHWPFSEVQEEPVIVTELSGPAGTWKLYAHAVEEQQLIVFYSICPLTVPEDKRPKMANFLTRVNYGLAIGNFELDFDDGEVRYKTSLAVGRRDVNPALVKRLVRANGIAMERYLPGIEAVITGKPPVPALERQRLS